MGSRICDPARVPYYALGLRRTSHDEEVFATAFRALGPLTDAELAAGLTLCRVTVLKRGEHLLRQGQPATEVALLVEGLLREYFVVGDPPTERTKAFITPGKVSGSLADLLSGEGSRAFIVAEEPSRMLVAPYVAFRDLGLRMPGWSAVGRAALEALLLSKAGREWELLGLDAEARYRRFRAQNPGLEAQVAARHVASYLGITPVHLSRLRRRLRAR